MKLYKVTNASGYTGRWWHAPVKWGPGVTHKKKKMEYGYILCTSDVLHAFFRINNALIYLEGCRQIVDGFRSEGGIPKLWLAEGTPVIRDSVKAGCIKLTTIKEIRLPAWYKNPETRKAVCKRVTASSHTETINEAIKRVMAVAVKTKKQGGTK